MTSIITVKPFPKLRLSWLASFSWNSKYWKTFNEKRKISISIKLRYFHYLSYPLFFRATVIFKIKFPIFDCLDWRHQIWIRVETMQVIGLINIIKKWKFQIHVQSFQQHTLISARALFQNFIFNSNIIENWIGFFNSFMEKVAII